MSTDWSFWQQVGSSALGSGAAFAIIKITVDWYRDWRERAEAKKYLGLQLAVIFEKYAVTCASRVSSHENSVRSSDTIGEKLRSIPQIQNFPESPWYKLVDSSLLNEIFGFPLEIEIGQQSCSFDGEIGQEEDYFTSVLESSVLLGQKSLNIAKSVRSNCKLVARVLVFENWNVEEHYIKEVDSINRQRSQREKENEKRNNLF